MDQVLPFIVEIAIEFGSCSGKTLLGNGENNVDCTNLEEDRLFSNLKLHAHDMDNLISDKIIYILH